MRHRALVLVALAAASCVTSGKLRESATSLRAEVDKAKRSGAAKCAPKELALAESNVDFADAELASGDPRRAKQHLDVAEVNVTKALDMSKTCAPTQVIIAKKEEPKAVRIEKIDTDGDGIPDIDDQCPNEPGPPENHGCPLVKDTDGDGIPDEIDRCPLDPEDFDGWQDEDGCPDPDNDGDGIVDKNDACPNEPGPIENKGCPVGDKDLDGVPDNLDKCPNDPGPPPDGCPRHYSLIEVQKDQIVTKVQVKYATAKYRVLPESYKLLNQIVQAMNDYPKMKVLVAGHTDSRGKQASNMKLSQRRAESVVDYLVTKGISQDRLQAIGYGPTQPVASNKTNTGRAKNRRTEFKITSME